MFLSAGPVAINYGYDNNLSLNNNTVYTFDNLDFTTSALLVSTIDIAVNNDQLLLLTNNIRLSEAIVNEIPYQQPSSYVCNSLITNNSGSYLYTTNSTATTGSTLSFTTNLLSATVFTLSFQPGNLVQIYYSLQDNYGNTVNLYLTTNTSTSAVSAGPIFGLTTSTYTYYYLLSGQSFSLISNTPGLTGVFVSNNGTSLSFNNTTPSSYNQITIPTSCIYNFTRFADNTNLIQTPGKSDLVQYVKTNNSLSVNKFSGPVAFNYLVASPYKALSAGTVEGINLDANIFPLKNYYSPTHTQTAVLTEQLRSYTNIFTGLNQEDGYDKIYLTYNSGYANTTFTKDSDTYFHYPFGANTLPLSSSELVSYGAFSNTVPSRSDRVFKKLGSYQNYSSWGNSSGTFYPIAGGTGSAIQNGTYFCSWLSAGATPSITPVWVDRFYDSKYINTIGINGNSINSLSGILTYSTNNYPNLIWDYPSQLTFEPGVLYYYHRIGDSNNTEIVSSIPNLTYQFNNWAPVLINNVTGLSAGQISSFTTSNSGVSDQINTPYYILSGTYGVINTNQSDFVNNIGNTLAFYLYQDNWSNIVGDQLVGNYFDGGIGLFNNNPILTPYFTVTSMPSATTSFNTKLNVIDYETYTTLASSTSDPLSGNVFSIRGTYDGSYYIIDNFSSNKFLSVYDPDDLITSKVPLTATDSNIGTQIILDAVLHLNTTTNTQYIILKTRPTSTTCWYHKFTTLGTLVQVVSSSSYNNFAIDLSGNPVYYNSPWVSASTLSGTGSCIDSTGTLVFAISGNNLLLNGSPILAVNLPEDVNCDQNDNIWITYNNNSLAKISNTGKVLWTKQINTGDAVLTNNIRTIDFIAENTASGVIYYGLLLDGKSQYIYKIDMNGVVVAKTFVSGLIPNGDCTGFDYQRKYIKPNLSTPGIQVKLISNDSTLSTPVPVYTTLNYSVSALAPGWHHFTITYDQTNVLTLYVDGISVVRSNTNTPTGQFLYRILNYKNNPQILLGTSNFKTGTLNQWIELPGTYIYNGSIADFRFYNITLTPSDIKSLAKSGLYNQFTDLNWNIPVGTRAYVEEIERLFLHRLPGSKSQYYDIKIKNSGIADPNVQAIVENNLKNAASQITPAYAQLRNIIWE